MESLTTRFCVIGGLAVVLAGTAGRAQHTPPPLGAEGEPYRLEASDEIEVRFEFAPEFNQIVTIRPDGIVSLHPVGEAKVEGLSVDGAQRLISGRFAKILRDPSATLILRNFNKPAFIVLGHVARPGRFDLRGEILLTEAIAMAGGFNPGAKQSEVLLVRRRTPAMAEVRKVDVRKGFRTGNVGEDIALKAGDAVLVSRSKVGKVERFVEVSRLGLFFSPFR